MKLIDKLAIEAVEERDLIKNENRRYYGEGFMAGFRKCKQMLFNDLIYNRTNWIEIPKEHLNQYGESETEGPTCGAV